MKILNGIELIDLAIYINKTLILTDFHIGYEEALNKQGVMVPRFQFQEIMKRIENIFSKLKNHKIDRIIVNGDIKHEFGAISDQEWRHTLKLLDYFRQHCKEIILVKGNHDTMLGPIAKKRNIKVVEHYLISTIEKIPMIDKKTIKKININNEIEKKLKINNKKIINGKNSIGNKILVTHGNKIPSKALLNGVKTIIIGHEHPAVSIREGPRAELFKAYLIGKWKNKNLIAQPSFNLVTEGTDVIKEELLSPFLKQNLKSFDVVIVADKMYRFGKIRDLE
ncbi:MAG: metallophosphoesterase [Candidatus Woesearchaeota archaeon]